MKVLVTGANGQLGHDLVNELKRRDIEVLPADITEMDITDQKSVDTFIKSNTPSVIVHCAAWTDVDLAEDNKEPCFKVNTDGTRNIAKAAAEINAKLIYISTDYVFSGEGTTPWDPDKSIPNPLNVYGESKYKGEIAVEECCKDYLIVRISWVFGKNGKNFIKTMLNLGKNHKELKVVDDQIGSPTYTKDLAKLLVDMIEKNASGIFHATNTGYCSWYDLAKETFREAILQGHNEYNEIVVKPVHFSEYPTKALRPENSRMDCTKLEVNGFHKMPAWQDAVQRFLKEIEY